MTREELLARRVILMGELDHVEAELRRVDGEATRPTIAELQERVAAQYGFRRADLLGPCRHKSVFARHTAMYLARTLTRASLPEIGEAFERNHTTVMAAVRKIEALRAREAA